jgi:coronin-1B/1C/6
MFDPRAGGDAVRITDGHGGIKGARIAWMGDLDKFATTGFSKMSDRQVSIWETGGLGNIRTITLDQSAGVIMPFWTDKNILFLAGKGDGNIRYYEFENDNLYALSEHKSSDPQRGMCFLPRRGLSVSDCEIARAYKVAGSSIEPIAFIVPRKADNFQSDIFPPAPSSEPALSAGEFFSGKTVAPNLVSLENGAVFASTQSPLSAPPSVSSLALLVAPSMVKTTSLPTPTSAAPPPSARSETVPFSALSFVPTPSPAPVTASPVQTTNPSRIGSIDNSAALREENAQLTAELREAREKIRNLELQVEGYKANTRRAVEALNLS